MRIAYMTRCRSGPFMAYLGMTLTHSIAEFEVAIPYPWSSWHPEGEWPTKKGKPVFWSKGLARSLLKQNVGDLRT